MAKTPLDIDTGGLSGDIFDWLVNYVQEGQLEENAGGVEEDSDEAATLSKFGDDLEAEEPLPEIQAIKDACGALAEAVQKALR